METIRSDNAVVLRALDAQTQEYEELLGSSKSTYEPIQNIIRDHFVQLPKDLLDSLYDVFLDDFEMFGYDVADFYRKYNLNLRSNN